MTVLASRNEVAHQNARIVVPFNSLVMSGRAVERIVASIEDKKVQSMSTKNATQNLQDFLTPSSPFSLFVTSSQFSWAQDLPSLCSVNFEILEIEDIKRAFNYCPTF
jgi:hypothetical protein